MADIEELVERLKQAANGLFPASPLGDYGVCDEAATALSAQQREIAELRSERDKPEVQDFMRGVPLEAQHQRARWGAEHDAGKTTFDWFWLVGYLAQKAASSAVAGDTDKAKHHTISTAAALANWHLALCGDTTMRPGIGPGNGGDEPGSAYDLASRIDAAALNTPSQEGEKR